MKNLTIILAISALLIFGFGCANYATLVPMGNALEINTDDFFHCADDSTSENNDRQYIEPDDNRRKRNYSAASICRGSGNPTHICGKSDTYY